MIEVADSTFQKDCGLKAKAYARSHLLDYWVLDVTERKLHVFRDPNQDGYLNETVLQEDAAVSPLQFPNAIAIVRDLLPKVRAD